MFRSTSQRYLLLMLLVFAGQAVAMPFLDCCMATENTRAESEEINGHHDMGMSDHHPSESAIHNNNHADETYCNHQCDVCMGTVLLVEFTAFTTQAASSQLNENYHLLLPVSSTDNPFRPPIFS